MFDMHLFSEAAVWICHFRGQEGQGKYKVSYFASTYAVTFARIIYQHKLSEQTQFFVVIDKNKPVLCMY